MIDVREYNDRDGRNPYAVWFNRPECAGRGQSSDALTRLALGNFSNVKGVGSGVFECPSISDWVTASILARTASASSSCLAVVRRSASSKTSQPPCPGGRIIGGE